MNNISLFTVLKNKNLRFRIIMLFLVTNVLSIAILFTIQLYISHNFILNNTTSLPQKVFKIEDFAQRVTLKPGDYITLCPNNRKLQPLLELYYKKKPDYAPRGQCPNGQYPFIKIIAAVPKQSVDINPKTGITVEGTQIHGTNYYAKDFKKPFQFKGIVPEDHYIVYTHKEDSYDSRYFGFITKDELFYKVHPVF